MRSSGRRAHIVVTLLVGAGMYLLFLSGPGTAAGPENAAGKVLAEVNGEMVSAGDYRRFAMRLGHAAAGEEIKRELLNKLIEEMLIIQEAGNRGVVASDAEVDQGIRDFIARYGLTEEEFEKSIADRGMSREDYRRWLREDVIVGAKLAHAEVDSRIAVGEGEIAGYYDRHRDLFVSSPEQLTVAAIIMDISENPSAEELTGIKMKALRIVSDLRRGASFEDMASLYSDDPSREQGGVLGEFRTGELPPAFEKALAGLKEGEVSEPVWTVNRVGILRLEARKEALYLPLNEVRSAIYSGLLEERKDRDYKQWVRSLWEKASIVIH